VLTNVTGFGFPFVTLMPSPALIALAPKQSEPPFAVSQIFVLALFVWLGVAAGRGFRSEPHSR